MRFISDSLIANAAERDLGKSNNLNMFQFCMTCLLFNLFTVKITLLTKH